MSTPASTETYHSVSRDRTESIIVAPCTERVARAANRLQELHGPAVVNLPAEPLDVHVDQIRSRVEGVIPDVIGDRRAADNVTGTPSEVFEQAVLARGESDLIAPARNS